MTLLGVRPPVWRRIQVLDGTLNDLHRQIQAAIGWKNAHLHEFTIGNHRYTAPELRDDDTERARTRDAERIRLSKLFCDVTPPFWFRYDYDFGDGWRHHVVFERALPGEIAAVYPRCIDGRGACPPEDCGGPGGYEELLAALSDPDHARHAELTAWCAAGFDPDAFDAAEATRMMCGARFPTPRSRTSGQRMTA